jgi:integrase
MRPRIAYSAIAAGSRRRKARLASASQRREVHVRHQLKHVNGGTVFDLPTRGKVRTVPLSETVAVALAEHLRRFPPAEVTLPWREPGGAPTTLELVFANTAGGPVNRGSFNDRVWKPALATAGVEPTRENGYHVLRHTYASTQPSRGVGAGGGEIPRARGRRGATAAHVRPRDAAGARPGASGGGCLPSLV